MQSAHDCPRCRLALIVGRAGDFTAHACGRCGGMWVDHDSLALLSGTGGGGPQEARQAVKLAKAATRAAVAHADTAPDDLPCPECAEPMLRTRMHDAWIDVDICHDHGSWFDAGEVERFAQSIANPKPKDWRRAPKPKAGIPAPGRGRHAPKSSPREAFGHVLDAVGDRLHVTIEALDDDPFEL